MFTAFKQWSFKQNYSQNSLFVENVNLFVGGGVRLAKIVVDFQYY